MSVSLDNLEPIDVRPIKRALISVYDKTGLEDLARALGEAGVRSSLPAPRPPASRPLAWPSPRSTT